MRGKGHQIKYLLAHLGVDYVQEVFEHGKTKETFMQPWLAKKCHLGLDFPNLPYLIDGKIRLSESKAIMAYLCRKHKPELLGRNAAEVGTVDMVSRVHDAMHAQFGAHCIKTGDTPELQSDLEKGAQRLSNFMRDKAFVVGEQLTFVDFSVFELLDHMNFCSKGRTLRDHQNLHDYYGQMEQVPGFREYWADDHKCPKASFKQWTAKLNN